MRRLNLTNRGERGAVVVIVAVMLVLLISFGAIAVDLGAAWADRKEVQNGADAGSLSIAQQCAKDNCPSDPAAVADAMARGNKVDLQATGRVVALDVAAKRVTVEVSTDRSHWFAPLIGITSSRVTARATAEWWYPYEGLTAPLAFSLCEFWWQTGVWLGSPDPEPFPLKIKLMTKSAPSGAPAGVSCGTQAAHNESSGGFGWIVPTDPVACKAHVAIGDWVYADPGSSPPCNLQLTAGKKIAIPLFDAWKGTGSNAQYRLTGFAVIEVRGWCFQPNSMEFNSDGNCTASNRHLRGMFVTYVELGEDFEGSLTAPNFGLSTVYLSQ